MPEENEYLFGTHDDELRRLGFQHQVWIREAAAAWHRAGFGAGSHVLDLGCGPGYTTCDLALLVGQGGSVTGVDVSPRFVAHTRAQAAARGLGNVVAHVQDAESLELAAGEFDGVYSRWVLTYLRRPEEAIRGAARALKPGGRMVIHDYSHYEGLQLVPEHPAFRRGIDIVIAQWRESGGDPAVGARLPAMMADAGLEVLSITPVHRVARPGDVLWRWPRTFFDNYLPALVASGAMTEDERLAFDAAWRAAEAHPGGFFATPPMLEVLAIRH
ncbi:methyltransferase domain-containing protein [Longimicrobium sp.]|uniref:methyltransferase domain-containing protein n=1 Tax=Longimicrobium sp. TaxID=2029185 RepID=UPI002ED9A804